MKISDVLKAVSNRLPGQKPELVDGSNCDYINGWNDFRAEVKEILGGDNE